MPQTPRPRLLLLDLARSLALVGMVAFHLCYDLAMVQFIAPQTPFSGFFWYLARLTAGSFLFLAGLGLWLSHGQAIQWQRFWQRLGKIAAAAAVVSVATYLAMPEAWIFFGILHSIALASLLGLLVLRLPIAMLVALAVAVFALPYCLTLPGLPDSLIWIGLSGRIPLTADFEPLFPWFAPFLLGMATGKLFARFELWHRLALPDTKLLRWLSWPGQHSLAIYLLHQPLLLSAVIGAAYLLR